MIEVSASEIRVSGPMVIATAAAIKEEGVAALAGGATRVDLAGVTEADSSAVAVLLAWVRAAEDRQQAIAIVQAPGTVRSLAALYGVSDLLPLS